MAYITGRASEHAPGWSCSVGRNSVRQHPADRLEQLTRTADPQVGPDLPPDWQHVGAHSRPPSDHARSDGGARGNASFPRYLFRGPTPAAAWPQPWPPGRRGPFASSPLLQNACRASRRTRLVFGAAPNPIRAFSWGNATEEPGRAELGRYRIRLGWERNGRARLGAFTAESQLLSNKVLPPIRLMNSPGRRGHLQLVA